MGILENDDEYLTPKDAENASVQVSFSGYLKLVNQIQKKNPSWRKGQTHFNVLHDVRPDLAELIRGTSIDPFHKDCVLSEFLHRVATMW